MAEAEGRIQTRLNVLVGLLIYYKYTVSPLIKVSFTSDQILPPKTAIAEAEGRIQTRLNMLVGLLIYYKYTVSPLIKSYLLKQQWQKRKVVFKLGSMYW